MGAHRWGRHKLAPVLPTSMYELKKLTLFSARRGLNFVQAIEIAPEARKILAFALPIIPEAKYPAYILVI